MLFYNLVEWLGGRLPWDDLEDKVSPSVIQNMKVEAFKDPNAFLASCFPSSSDQVSSIKPEGYSL